MLTREQVEVWVQRACLAGIAVAGLALVVLAVCVLLALVLQ